MIESYLKNPEVKNFQEFKTNNSSITEEGMSSLITDA